MMEGGHLGDIHHHDEGSIITLDIMLTPSSSFEGGRLSTLEALGAEQQALQEHTFEQGDALLFVSHKYHCVSPVTRGLRQVLVSEYWWGEARECGPRCEQPHGECTFTDAKSESRKELFCFTVRIKFFRPEFKSKRKQQLLRAGSFSFKGVEDLFIPDALVGDVLSDDGDAVLYGCDDVFVVDLPHGDRRLEPAESLDRISVANPLSRTFGG